MKPEQTPLERARDEAQKATERCKRLEVLELIEAPSAEKPLKIAIGKRVAVECYGTCVLIDNDTFKTALLDLIKSNLQDWTPFAVTTLKIPIDKRATFWYTFRTVEICELLSPSAFAKEINTPARTVQFWCKNQLIPAEQTISKRYKIPAYCIDLFLNGFIPVVR
jgi:hypothetical protein